MAEFNDRVVKNCIENINECGTYLCACLSKEDYNLLFKKWIQYVNIVKSELNISFRQFAFENIEVKLKEDF